MAVAAVNIVIEQGTDYQEVFTVKNPDGSPLNLTGHTGVAKIRKFPTSSVYTPFSVGIVSTAGQVVVSLANTITSCLKQGRYYYDVVVISPTGTKSKVIDGMVLVNATDSITQTAEYTVPDCTGGSTLTVGTRYGYSGINSTDAVSNVSVIRFDRNTGFAVTGLGNGEVFVELGSSFNPWYVSGQSTLSATGEESIEFVAGPGIAITTKNTATGIGTGLSKALTITATGGQNYWSSTSAGIHTLSNVGIGTTNPQTKLQINGVLGFEVLTSYYGYKGVNISIGDTTTGANVTPHIPSDGRGVNNIFMGINAGHCNTGGSNNNFFGFYSGYCNGNGRFNNFFGKYAGYCSVDGDNNNFFGSSAGYYNDYGSYNNFFGSSAGYYNTTGNDNNFFGRYAGFYNTNGRRNNFFGCGAGFFNTTGCRNNFLGDWAGYRNTTGISNNFLGYYTGGANDTGSYNNFFGHLTGSSNKTGDYNNFFGSFSGRFNITGCHNVFLGAAGLSTAASQKVLIGSGIEAFRLFDSPNPNKDTQLAIGIRTATFWEPNIPSRYWIVGDENFNVGIGTINPTSKLTVGGDARITGILTVGSSSITLDGTTNVLTVGTGVTINGSTGIISATSIYVNGNSVVAGFVSLGTDTTGDYVQSVSGTSNQITVTSGTGEGSTPTLSIPNQFTAPQDVTVTRDLQVSRNLNVTGNITIGGTSATIFSQELKVYDPDIVLGFRTDASNNDISTDNTANHGGIAIASTEGTPLVQLYNVAIGETNPATYKKIMWFKSGSFSGLGTDAWLSNYAVGIGSTQFPSGTRLAAGAVQFTERDLAVVRNINASGIVTGSSFRPSSGYIQAADGTNSLYIYSGTGNIAFQGTIGASQINSSSGYKALDFGNTTTPSVNITNSLNVGSAGTVITTTNNGFVGIGTTNPRFKLEVSAVGASGTSLYVNGDARITGILSVGQGTIVLNGINDTIGIGTRTFLDSNGNLNNLGVVTATKFVGDGSGLTNLPSGGGSSQWVTTAAGIHTLSNVGVGTTNPTSKLTVGGDVRIAGVVTATAFVGDGSGLTNIGAATSLGGLSGVDLTNNNALADGRALIYQNGEWIAGPVVGGVSYTYTPGGTDPNYSNVLLHYSFQTGTVSDLGPAGRNPLLINNVQLNSSESPYPGGKSAYFNGSSYIKIPTIDIPDFTDFTVEFWMRLDGQSSDTVLSRVGNAAYGDFVRAETGGVTVTAGYQTTIGGPISTGVWHHIAFVSRSNVHYAYVDGQEFTYGVSWSGPLYDLLGASSNVSPQSSEDTFSEFNGHLADLRITSGVARYTGPFTPQLLPFPSQGGQNISIPYSIDRLDDVNTSTTPPTNGQALVWNSSSSQWVPQTVGVGTTSSINTTGIITATKFVGDGSSLTNLPSASGGIDPVIASFMF